MGRNSVPRVRLCKGTRWRGGGLPHARPYRTRSVGPKPPLVPVSGGSTALDGRGLEGAQNALKWPPNSPRWVRAAPWSRANGVHPLAVRPGAIGARKTASWGPCDPLGLRFFAYMGLFVVRSPGGMTQG